LQDLDVDGMVFGKCVMTMANMNWFRMECSVGLYSLSTQQSVSYHM